MVLFLSDVGVIYSAFFGFGSHWCAVNNTEYWASEERLLLTGKADLCYFGLYFHQ